MPNPFCVPGHRIQSQRVLDEIEKNSFIALSGKEGHSRLLPSKLCILTQSGW